MNRRDFLRLIPLALTAPAIASIASCEKARAGYMTVTFVDHKRGIITVDGDLCSHAVRNGPGCYTFFRTNVPEKFAPGMELVIEHSATGRVGVKL